MDRTRSLSEHQTARSASSVRTPVVRKADTVCSHNAYDPCDRLRRYGVAADSGHERENLHGLGSDLPARIQE